MRPGILDARGDPADQDDLTLRPGTLADFTGQQAVRDNLAVFVQAALVRAQAMDHVLFSGPPGLGKTTLAQVVARELGVNIRITSGPTLQRPGDLAAILTSLQEKDVLFIDEIHRLNAPVEEILYSAMEDFRLDLMVGEGPGARSVRMTLPPFTLIGATTRTGLLTSPLRDRFGILFRLVFYTHDELKTILHRAARLWGMGLEDAGALEIARRSRGTPRIAGRLLRRVRDFALVARQDTVTAALADQALTLLDVDHQGLDTQDRRYLTVLADFYQGGPAGLETLAAVLAEQKDTVEEVIEPYLMQQGLIQRTPRGRVLTREGSIALGRTVPGPEQERAPQSALDASWMEETQT
jgi:Holliday junction DNA helicase RuvB